MENLLGDLHWEAVEGPVPFVPNLRKLSVFMIQEKGPLNIAPKRFIARDPSVSLEINFLPVWTIQEEAFLHMS